MSNNYYAFSTAPGPHTSGASVPVMHGHPNNVHHNPGPGNANAGMMEGMPLHMGANAPGGMVAYPLPSPHHHQQQQQQQQHQQLHSPVHTNRHNLGPGMAQAPFHGTGVAAAPPAGAMNAGGGGGSGGVATSGPAVPAPRSTAALIAEVTGAPPPPPPARSRSSLSGISFAAIPITMPGGAVSAVAGMPAGVAGHAGSAGASGGPHRATPPAPTTTAAAATAATTANNMSTAGIQTPKTGPAVPPTPTGNDAATAALVSPSYKAFTTSAATMLSTLGAASAGRDAAGGSTDAGAAGGVRGGDDPNSEFFSAFTKVEVQVTVESTEQPASATTTAAHVGEDAAGTWDPTAETAFELDFMDLFQATLFADSDGAGTHYLHENDMEQGRMERDKFLDCRNPRQSAAIITARLEKARTNQTELHVTLTGLTRVIVALEEYEVVALLAPRLAVSVRYSLVHFLLTRLVDARAFPALATPYIRGLAAMMGIGMISSSSYAAMADLLLQEDASTAVALQLLTVGLANCGAKNTLRATLASSPGMARRLRDLYTNDASLELSVAQVTRLWDRATPVLNTTVGFDTGLRNNRCPVTCMSYFAVRDELISGHMDGSVVLWGPPQMVREKVTKHLFPQMTAVVRPRGIVPLPLDCVPVGMAGQRMDGQYLAIASMPYKSRAPYNAYCAKAADATAARGRSGSAEGEQRAGDAGGRSSSSGGRPAASAATTGQRRDGAGVGAIIVITCNENSLRWNKGEVILRPPGVALTAITAFRNSIVAVGESVVRPTTRPANAAAAAAAAVASTADAASQNRLSFVDVAHGTVMRQIPQAHDDFITTLNVLEEGSYVLLSGGRDAAVKLWDPRSREDSPVVNTGLCTDATAQTSTIASVCPTGYSIATAAVDGSVLVWDLRSMAAPQVRHKLHCPIVDMALVNSKTLIAATSCGLVTLSLDTLEPLDLRHQEDGYLHVVPNSTGELVFAASTSGSLAAMAVGWSAARQ